MCGKIVFLTVAALSALAVVHARPPGGPGGKCGFEGFLECCPSLPRLVNETAMKSCRPQGPPPGGPPSGGPPSGAPPPGAPKDTKGGRLERGPGGGDHHKNRSCMMECAFSADGLTTTGADGKVTVNLDAVNTRLATIMTGNWSSLLAGAKANCTTTAPVVPANQTCTSGSGEVGHCLLKYMMKNCPNAKNSTECQERAQMMGRMEGRRMPGGPNEGFGKMKMGDKPEKKMPGGPNGGMGKMKNRNNDATSG